MPSISVIIPLFNKERYIQRTLDSVFSQTFIDFECIVIDSSDDNSPSIVREFSDLRLIHVITGKNGAASARNLGVSQAKADFVAFLDADDEWSKDHLQCLYNLYKAYPNAGLFSTPYIKIREDNSPMVMIFAEIPKPPWQGYIPRYFWTCSQGDVPVHSSSCAIRKEIFHKMGGFREDLTYGEDLYLWGRIALQYPVAFCWEGIAIYHTEAEGRICNESHIITDPLSIYLEEYIKAGTLENQLSIDCKKYIHRRKNSVFFSNILNGGFFSLKIKDQEVNLKQDPKRQSGCIQKSIIRICTRLYNSRLYNVSRRIRCVINGWYIL